MEGWQGLLCTINLINLEWGDFGFLRATQEGIRYVKIQGNLEEVCICACSVVSGSLRSHELSHEQSQAPLSFNFPDRRGDSQMRVQAVNWSLS